MSLNSVFRCEICSDRFETGKYEDWVVHLTGEIHQKEANNKLFLWKQWEYEEGTYLLSGRCLDGSKKVPWTMLQLAEWLSTFGLLTELFHERVHGFVVFSLQGIGSAGISRMKEVAKVRDFRGHEILIKLKSQYGPSEWDLMYSADDQTPKQEETRRKGEQAKSKKSKDGKDKGKQGGDHGRNKDDVFRTPKKSENHPQSSSSVQETGASSSAQAKSDISSQKAPSVPKSTKVFVNSSRKSSDNSFNSKAEKDPKRSQGQRQRQQNSGDGIRPPGPGPSRSQEPGSDTDNRSCDTDVSFSKLTSVSNDSKTARSFTNNNFEKGDLETEKDKKKKKKKSKSRNKAMKKDASAPDGQMHHAPAVFNKNVNSSNMEQKPSQANRRGEAGIGKTEIVCSPINVTHAASSTTYTSNLVSLAASTPTCSVSTSSTGGQHAGSSSVEVAATPEFNFRGGFTPVIHRTRPMSESSDRSTGLGQHASKIGSDHSEVMHPNQRKKLPDRNEQGRSRATLPPQQVSLQQPVFPAQRPPSGPPRFLPTQPHPQHHQQRNGSQLVRPLMEGQRRPPRQERQHKGYGAARPQNPQIPPGTNFSPFSGGQHQHQSINLNFNRGPHSQYQTQQQMAFSSIFTSQIPPGTLAALADPVGGHRNNPARQPYIPQPGSLPYFFDLFQKLVDDPCMKKLKNDALLVKFNRLDLNIQLEEFFLAQTLTGEELRLRWQLILDILYIVRQDFPNCELYPFGSILTGLGDYNSDIDIYVDLLGETNSRKPIEPNRRLSSTQSLDIVKKILKKSSCPHTSRRFLSMLIPVKSAKVPILKLTHGLTKINCDLSFENRLSVQNTKLLRFYMNLDQRIFRFMVLIRFWAKFHYLTGSNYIKNYALTLLVLVYLCKKSLVPPVHLLQKLKADQRKIQRLNRNPDEIDGWDASFCDNIDVIKKNFQPGTFPGTNSSQPSSESQVLIKMAIEFFSMYANVDFSAVVVCPLLGEMLPKEKFLPGYEDLPKSLDRYTDWAMGQPLNRRLNINSVFCVQDPFLLSFNVGSVTPQSTVFKFQIACAKAVQVLERAGRLNSLLDVMIPLPDFVGEKKFMRVYKTESKTVELKNEIKTAVRDEGKKESKTEAGSTLPAHSKLKAKPQKSNYVLLPSHLLHLDPLMDEKSIKVADKKAKWESYMDFNLSSQFESVFVTELTICKIHNWKKIDLMRSLCELWREFTLDFIESFFVDGLKLQVTEKKETVTEADYEMNDGRRAEEGRSRWRIKPLSKKEEENAGPSAKDMIEIDRLGKKILSLPEVTTPVYYKVLTIQATYPFWENRPSVLGEVAKDMPCDEIIRIPVSKAEAKQLKQEKKKDKNKKKSSQSVKDDSSVDLKLYNPISLEQRVSDVIERKYKSSVEKGHGRPFSNIALDVLVKLDVSLTNGQPQLFLLFELDRTKQGYQDDFTRAMHTLSTILERALPAYQIFRLAKWLELKPVPAQVSSSSSHNESTEDAELDAHEQSGLKKSRRTKSEEDLLIPSSSSSSASGSDNEEGEEEEGNLISDEDLDKDLPKEECSEVVASSMPKAVGDGNKAAGNDGNREGSPGKLKVVKVDDALDKELEGCVEPLKSELDGRSGSLSMEMLVPVVVSERPEGSSATDRNQNSGKDNEPELEVKAEKQASELVDKTEVIEKDPGDASTAPLQNVCSETEKLAQEKISEG